MHADEHAATREELDELYDNPLERLQLLGGDGEIEVDGETRSVSKGEAGFVPADTDHRFTGYEVLALLVIFNGPHTASKSR